MTRKIDVGEVLAERELRTISDEFVRVPHGDRLVHLEFRRFAGCPFCNLHLRSLVERRGDIEAAGIDEIVVFHSSAESFSLSRARCRSR